jgi:hypothetical protein
LEECNALEALEKLHKAGREKYPEAGLERYKVVKGCCSKHFDYEKQVKVEYPQES